MGKVFNTIYGGSSSESSSVEFFVEVVEPVFHATSVTATKGLVTVNLTYDSEHGVWYGRANVIGEWVIAVTDGAGHANRKTVTVENLGPCLVSILLPVVPDDIFYQLEYVEGKIGTGSTSASLYFVMGSANTASKRVGKFMITSTGIYSTNVTRNRHSDMFRSDPMAVGVVADFGLGSASFFVNNGYSSGTTRAASVYAGLVDTSPHIYEVQGTSVKWDNSMSVISNMVSSVAALSSIYLCFAPYGSSGACTRHYYAGIYNSDVSTFAAYWVGVLNKSTGSVGVYNAIANSVVYSNRYIAGPTI